MSITAPNSDRFCGLYTIMYGEYVIVEYKGIGDAILSQKFLQFMKRNSSVRSVAFIDSR